MTEFEENALRQGIGNALILLAQYGTKKDSTSSRTAGPAPENQS